MKAECATVIAAGSLPTKTIAESERQLPDPRSPDGQGCSHRSATRSRSVMAPTSTNLAEHCMAAVTPRPGSGYELVSVSLVAAAELHGRGARIDISGVERHPHQRSRHPALSKYAKVGER